MKRTRKRIISILAGAALSVCPLPQSTPLLLRSAITASAEGTANPASEFTYTNIGTGIQITGWNGSGETVVIPSEINGLPVDEISGSAFKNQTLLTKIVIPDNVEAIGQNAFYGCLSLTDIMIPDGVTKIAYNTFAKCGALKSVTIPESVTSIGKRAFDSTALTTVTLPQHLTEIGEYAFNTCYDLRSIVIPDGVAEISDNAFFDCRRLKSVTLPKNLKRIGISAFAHCGSLNSITLPDGTERIDSSAFQNSGLTEITIPASVTDIGGDSFGGCRGSLTIKGYTDSYAETYANRADIPFESLGDATEDPVIQSGTCGENLTWKLDSEGTLTISGTGKMDEYYSYYDTPWHEYAKDIFKVVIENGAENIGLGAFAKCSSLADVSIPDSVTEIGGSAFDKCTGLTEISLPKSIRGVLDGCAFAGCSSLKSIVIPEGVSVIGSKCFKNCTSLESVTIPDSVMDILSDAFFGCSALTEVVIPDIVRYIDGETFAGCSNLKCVTIPDRVTVIRENAFEGCPNLKIKGYAGSYAKTYANDHDIPFEAIDAADYNGDKEITAADAVLLARFVGEDTALTGTQIAKIIIHEPDFDGDGLVTIMDVTAILRKLKSDQSA